MTYADLLTDEKGKEHRTTSPLSDRILIALVALLCIAFWAAVIVAIIWLI